MEDTVVQPSVPPVEPEKPSFIKRVTTGKSFLLLFVILGVLALGSGIFAYNNVRNGGGNEEGSNQEEVGEYISDNVIVYGYWIEDKAVIAIHNLKNSTTGILTTLPTNVKHVKVTSPTTILYIADTDERDHGKTITERNLETGIDTVVFTADTDFGIDDYAVSPNGAYISIWEVKMPADSETLINGNSRVVNLDRTNTQKYTIYDEVFGTSSPVQYPIGITDNGDLFTDRFLANSGAGWAYGMSKSNLTGTVKSNIPGMENGTYSSQPVMSPDGKYIAFAGYSGTDGAVDNEGFREAILNPDTVKLLNTSSNAIETVQKVEENTQYPGVWWNRDSNKLIFTKFFQEGTEFLTEEFLLTPETKLTVQLPEPENNEGGQLYATLSNDNVLYAIYDQNPAFLGNLGGKYGQAVQKLFAFNKNLNTQTEISTGQKPAQLITVLSSSYFPEQIIRVSLNNSRDQLQLQSFDIKPKMAPKREAQQSEDIQYTSECRHLATRICNEKLGTNYKPSIDGFRPINPNWPPEFKKCFTEAYKAAGEQITVACYDSPLYLYGEEGQKVSVQVGVPLYSPNIPYSPERGVEAEISVNGSFYANGKLIEGFSFDYTPGIKKIQRPEYGRLASLENLKKTLQEYAIKLGLNEKETTDLLKEVKDIKSNYQYVSFFDHETSKKILPLYFFPTPDTYRNIVFYIEEFSDKPSLKPKNPTFEKIVRKGLTAIEISVIKK